MKLLLDECTPARLRFDFAGHEVRTLDQAGLKGLKNGVLLRTAGRAFDVLITVDQNIPHQQNLSESSSWLQDLIDTRTLEFGLQEFSRRSDLFEAAKSSAWDCRTSVIARRPHFRHNV